MSEDYEKLSQERKEGQAANEIPEWFITPGWQMVKHKYLAEGETVRSRYKTIAKAAAGKMPRDQESWEEKFFDLMWSGTLACSTPVMAYAGTDRGCSVSCSGQYVGDSIDNIYRSRHETAMLTKSAFGTSSYLGGIRGRGEPISKGGQSYGVLPVLKGYVEDMRYVAQGSNRRGAWAGYLPVSHPDFREIVDHVYNNPDDCNIGFNYHDSDIEKLEQGDTSTLARWQRHMKLRAVTGKGYFYFPDKVARLQPQMYKDLGLRSLASNLCTEITLHADLLHTYTCVLSSLNAAKYDTWKHTDAVFTATVFLDCIAQIFIDQGKSIPGLEKAVRFTEKGRALGLGLLGFHTYLQEHNIPFESVDAIMFNEELFKHIHDESLRASQWLAKELGEPEWCKGYGVRNTHRTAIAPNMSSALICGGVSQGIEPIVANSFLQPTAAGDVSRLNPTLQKVMKERGVYDQAHIDEINNNNGSVQQVDWLDDHEKLVFKTAYEIDQNVIVELAADRQKHLCQAQSLNLFFDADEDEAVIASVHKKAMLDPYIKSLYYMRSEPGVKASSGQSECVACEG